MNEKNLVSFKTRTKQEMSEIGRKGAAASNQKQKEKKTFRNTVQAILDCVVSEHDFLKLQKKHKDILKNMTYREVMSMIQVKKSILDADTRAFETMRDTAGEFVKKDDSQNVTNFSVTIVKNEITK